MSVPVVMMTRTGFVLHAAICFVAMLALGFKLDSNVRDAVLGKFLANLVLDVVGICACNRVKCGIIKLTVKAPDVDVVYVENAVDL